MNAQKPLDNNAPWFVYIVQCRGGTYYTGITTDLERRIQEHNDTRKAARYTRSRRPVNLAYAEGHDSRSEASKREHQLKQLTVAQKRSLIQSHQNHQQP
ncbi:MAG TPA: GIY-YIG nuclease family protein [Acidiferrobacteraceae bacterium]|nr:GIY-YIG nuclease family protein [Acidiferrobacteraceae bacterium]